jgi:hypothetical protein
MDDDDAAEIAPAQPELLTLDAVLTLTRARSIETRIQCFSESIPQALSTDVPSDAVALLSDTIVSLLEVYDDSRSTHACLQAIGALGRRSDFGSDFVRALVARLLAETSSSVPLTPSGKLFALRSLCAALRADFEAATGTAAAPRQGFTALALAKGSQEWRRSKIMLVGDGRAGKTAISRSLVGKEYTDTESTIGISEMACEVRAVQRRLIDCTCRPVAPTRLLTTQR